MLWIPGFSLWKHNPPVHDLSVNLSQSFLSCEGFGLSWTPIEALHNTFEIGYVQMSKQIFDGEEHKNRKFLSPS